MKRIRYFWAEGGKLHHIDETDKLIQDVKWHPDETLKVEIWPFDLKIDPTRVPYKNNKKQNAYQELIDILTANRAEKNARPSQKSLIRLNQTSAPYSEEFTKRDDARNRTYLSPRIPKGRKNRKEPPAQDDAPF